MWTVLGQRESQSNAADGDKDKGEGKDDKVCWVAYFEDREAYHVTHKAAQEPGKGRANFTDEIMKHPVNVEGGFPANMVGFTFGPMLHLENSWLSTGFAMVVSRKLPDAVAAAAFLEAEKSHWAELMANEAKDSLCRVTLFAT